MSSPYLAPGYLIQMTLENRSSPCARAHHPSFSVDPLSLYFLGIRLCRRVDKVLLVIHRVVYKAVRFESPVPFPPVRHDDASFFLERINQRNQSDRLAVFYHFGPNIVFALVEDHNSRA